MQRKPTIRDIAREAGVSDTAVSLCFQQNSRVSAATREKVLAIARRLNYFPNRSARNLRYGGSRTIGFVVIEITNPFYARMIRSAERIAHGLGYEILFAESHWDAQKEIRIVSNMIENRVAGILMCFCENTTESLTFIQQSKLPLIAVDTCPPHYRGPYVTNALASAGRMAAEHLLEAGCRHPVFFNASAPMSTFSSFQLLLKGFRQGLRAGNIDLPGAAIINADWTIEGGGAGFAALLASGQPFDGIFCVNDLCALGVIDAAERAGLRAGEDFAIMGVDNLEIGSISRVSLTSIDQPYDRIIALATRSMIESIENNQPCAVRRRLKPTLIVRDSTRLRRRAP
ncbi:MAG: LacI family DNA-binding transcriptional regulator [Spirochaetales bacterium]|nr:LacI family DNA-binding transcriptional regulator [Spirochaetales bacterium]